jgi:hypothetical protein
MQERNWTLTLSAPGEPGRTLTGVSQDEVIDIVNALPYRAAQAPSARETASTRRVAAFRNPSWDLSARAA